MNIKEFVSCLKEADLLGDALTELEAKQIFASVNLDDDLYGPSVPPSLHPSMSACLPTCLNVAAAAGDGICIRISISLRLCG